MSSDLLKQAKAMQSWSVKHYRHLHRYPELSLQEKATSKYCQDILKSLGYKIKKCFKYGFIADLNIKNTDKKIAFRADMDALPLTEKNTFKFISKNKSVAHMCGHDVHMTVALTTAKLLAENSHQLPCSVRFIFQPSEEEAPGGALGMIQAGCLDGVNEIYGLHCNPHLPVGNIGTRIGTLLAAADTFTIKITGAGTHAATPQYGLDPIYAAAKLVVELQSIISRRIDPVHPAVISVAKFQAGTAFNIIPDTAELAVTVRTFDAKDRTLIQKCMRQLLKGLDACDYKCQLNYIKGYNALINKPQGVNRLVEAAKKIIPVSNIDQNIDPVGGAEDFCYYLQKRPGTFFWLGVGNPKWKIIEPSHSPRFKIDENALPVGAAIMASLVI